VPLRITMLTLASAFVSLSLISSPSSAQPAPEELATAGIIQAGDEITVRCFTHEQLHVYIRGAVLANGTMELPQLGAIPMAGRGIQMLRDDLRRRYQAIYPRCSVNLSVQRPEAEDEEDEEEEPDTTAPALPTVAPEPELRQQLVRAGDQLLIRCTTGTDVHVDVQADVSDKGTISPPQIAELYVAGLRLEELERALLANYRPLFPGCSVEVRRVGEGLPTAPPTAEMVAPTVEVTAAERFAALPRFGLAVFAAPERPKLPTEEPAGEGQPRVTQAVPPSYVLGPGDELAVRVWTDAIEHLNVTVVIDADGKVYLDLLGEMTVTGQRRGQVEDDLRRRYQRFFNRAAVSVGLARTRVIEVRVTGDARRPGKHTLTGAATLFSALYAAGGPSEVGALRGIKLVRAGQEPLIVDLYDYLLAGEESGDVPLEPDDTVFIPPVQGMVGVTGQVRRPGRYELDEPTTLADALAMAAGLAPTGYAHNIQVWRVTERSQRQVININVDGEGAEGAKLPLQDGDLIVVQPVLEDPDNVVELAGAVRRPGSYQVFEGMTINDLINAAQGLEETAHTEIAALWRLNDELDYEATNFDLAAAMRGEAAHNLPVEARDRVIVFSEEQVEPPMEVEVKGAVLYPSIVAWTKGMRASDLLRQAGGPAEDAYLERSALARLGADRRRELVTVDLAAALRGGEEADVALERGDILTVFSRSEVVAPSEVQVGGFVQNPDTYPRLQEMRVSDAILAAGGLTAQAGDEIEYTPGGARGEVAPQILQLRRVGDSFEVEPDPVLGDNDHVAVLGTGDLIAKPPTVTIKGRVSRPGDYALRTTADEPDTLWKLLERAKGLLPDANPNGVVLYRQREAFVTDEQDDDLAQVIAGFNREMEEQRMEGGEQQRAMSDYIARGLTRVFTSKEATSLIVPPRELSATAWVRAVPIQGEALIRTDGKEGDFPLVDGDVVVVPSMPSTVTILGAVVKPGALPYTAGELARYYVQEAGGVTDDGWIGRLVIIRANGRVQASALHLEVRPGDVILVPSTYILRTIDKPSTLERILTVIGTFVTGYMIFK